MFTCGLRVGDRTFFFGCELADEEVERDEDETHQGLTSSPRSNETNTPESYHWGHEHQIMARLGNKSLEVLVEPLEIRPLLFVVLCIVAVGLRLVVKKVAMMLAAQTNTPIFWILLRTAGIYPDVCACAWIWEMVAHAGGVVRCSLQVLWPAFFIAICFIAVSQDQVWMQAESMFFSHVVAGLCTLLLGWRCIKAKKAAAFFQLILSGVLVPYFLIRSSLADVRPWGGILVTQMPTICKLSLQNASSKFLATCPATSVMWINTMSAMIIMIVYTTRVVSLCLLDSWGDFALNAALCIMFDVLDGQVMFDRFFHYLGNIRSKPKPAFVMPTIIEAVLLAMIKWPPFCFVLILVYWLMSAISGQTGFTRPVYLAKCLVFMLVVHPLVVTINYFFDKIAWGKFATATRTLCNASRYGEHQDSAAFGESVGHMESTGEERYKSYVPPEHAVPGPCGLTHEFWAHACVVITGILMIEDSVTTTLGRCQGWRVESCLSASARADHATVVLS